MLVAGEESQQNEIMSNFYQWLDSPWGSPNNTSTTHSLLKSYKFLWAHLRHLEDVSIGMPPFCAEMEMICSSKTFVGINVGTSAPGL